MTRAAKKKKSGINKDYMGYVFILPFVIVFIAFVLYPIAYTFWLSLTDTQLMSGVSGRFVGLDNFQALYNTPAFRTSITNTWLLWVLGFTPQIGFALVLAYMFTNSTLKLRGTGIFKALYYLPNLLMPATVAALFATYLTRFGPVNQAIIAIGLVDDSIAFLDTPLWARLTVTFIGWWMWFGQTTIIMVAGMTTISPALYESAMLDGASQPKMFWRITLPLIKPILLFVLVTALIGGLQSFDIPFLLTNGRGDPQGSIMTMNIFMYLRRSSVMGDIGSAASVSVVLFFMSSIVALVLFGLFREKDKD
ncbi:MAG: sugar ABC transporter permease [Defluviitaleaceae bacterium]|nr:sugar ABC transporter permease [Defluviitaleaceae bacterium]